MAMIKDVGVFKNGEKFTIAWTFFDDGSIALAGDVGEEVTLSPEGVQQFLQLIRMLLDSE